MNRVLLVSILCLAIVSCKVKKDVIIKKEVVTEIVEKHKEVKLKDYSTADGYTISHKYFPADSQNYRVKYLIMHYTAANFDVSVKLLTKRLSSHYLIDDKDHDSIELLVEECKRAWHAGNSYWGGKTGLNDTSIGIEIVNMGYKSNPNGSYTPYPSYQIDKVGKLSQQIIANYDIEPYNVIGHSDVAPQRKYDPGPEFPWKVLYEKYGVGAWYNEYDKQSFMEQFPEDSIVQTRDFIVSFQKDLSVYGYQIDQTGVIDSQTKNVIQKFQHHFRPEKYDGKLDRETWAILKSLVKKYK